MEQTLEEYLESVRENGEPEYDLENLDEPDEEVAEWSCDVY